ncbi:MAG: hypothetical protein ACO1OB_23905 [Archangium sp.]
MNARFITLATLVTLQACNCGPGAGGYLIFEDTQLSVPTTWSGTVEVRNSFELTAALTLEPCTKLLMPPGGKISIRNNGSIKANGSAACPVVFQSGKTAPAAGDWDGVEVFATASNDTRFTHTRFVHGNGAQYGVVWVEARATAGFENTTFEAAAGTAVELQPESRLSAFSGVSFVKTGRAVVSAGGDLVGALEPVTATDVPEARVVVTSPITKSATWKNLGVPVELPTTEILAPLEVSAGATLLFAPEAVVSVRDGGGLRLLGTAASPISIASSKSTPAPGDWRRIDIFNTAQANNLLRNVTVRHGGDSTYGVLWLEDTATVTLESTTFRDNSSCDVGVDGTVNDTGSTFMRCQ